MKRVAFLGVLIAFSLAILHACGDASHIYEGRIFREDRKCLGAMSSLDVVEGERPGNCEARCFVQRSPDGARAVYIASMCGPYPIGFDTSGADPACADALGALARNDSCLSDGGSTSPLPPPADAAADVVAE